MSAFHNSVAGERLALRWHRFGTTVSVAAMVSATLCALVALGGVVWHRKAEQDHQQHLAELER